MHYAHLCEQIHELRDKFEREFLMSNFESIVFLHYLYIQLKITYSRCCGSRWGISRITSLSCKSIRICWLYIGI